MLRNTLSLPLPLLSGIIRDGIAIDCGIGVTRIVFIDQNEVNPLRFCSVGNLKLTDTLQEIRARIAGKLFKIYITGVNNVWVKNIVESLFEVEIVFVEEQSALSKGFELISDHLNVKDLEYDPEDSKFMVENFKLDDKSHMINNMIKSMKFESPEKTENDDNKFSPSALFVTADNLVKYFMIKKDKSVQTININMISELTLRGLSHCISNVSNLKEIKRMASIGNRQNVDTQIFEVFSENENSPYGKLPPHIPIFAFGKLADFDKGKEEFDQNDLMESLCQMIFNTTTTHLMTLCKAYKINTVYISGRIFTSSNFLKNIKLRSILFPQLKFKIVNCDYISAIGTLKL